MGLLKEETKTIYGKKHQVISEKNGGFTAYYIISEHGNRVLHREDGKPAFIDNSGNPEYHIEGIPARKEQAEEYGLMKRKNHLQQNVKTF